ncbi:MAG: hypothetical protein AAF495_14905 [Pseudomonadota bacterium]
MAKLDVFNLTLLMSPTGQTLFDIEPLEFDLNTIVVNEAGDGFDIIGQSLATGQFFLVRAAFTLVSENEAVVHGFDMFNAVGDPAASLSGLDFSLAGDIDPFAQGLGLFLTGDDQITGAFGVDVLYGGPGNDSLNGAGGNDGAIYLGSHDEYSIQQVGAQLQISDMVGGRDGVDLLTDVELFQFADGIFNITSLLDVPNVDNGIYRFFNTNSGTHFYTASAEERDAVINIAEGFVFEGPAFKGVDESANGADAVFRFFNTDTGVHFYTISTDERDAILANLPQFVLEGEAYFAHDTAEAGTIPLFRFFNTETGTHFYSASAEERDAIIESLPQFVFEGTAYFVEGLG